MSGYALDRSPRVSARPGGRDVRRVSSLLRAAQDVKGGVQHDGGYAACGDAAVEHDLEPRREAGVEVRRGHRDQAEGEADGDDDDVRVPLESTRERVRIPVAATVPK